MNKKLSLLTLSLLCGWAFADVTLGDLEVNAVKLPVKRTITTTATTPKYYSWMSPDVQSAWNAGYKGQGTTISVVDDFSSGNKYYGSYTGTTLLQRHGEWTRMEAGLIAPSATTQAVDFYSATKLPLASTGLNVVNASYGLIAPAGYSPSMMIGSTGLQSDIVNAAKYGKAVVVKAAGNDAAAVAATVNGNQDYLGLALKGGVSTIYAGALSSNGTTSAKATLASYSNYAGSDLAVQKQFLVVGVEGNKTGLYGTSFAAPILSGYASVLGSKFKTATATQITNQLLNTARTDTLQNYTAAKYGRGEASLSRALAPVSIK